MNSMKKYLLLLLCLFCFELFAQSSKVIYISPNNDGVQDELTVPLAIQDKRFISEWSFIITDEAGAIVRTIGNKYTKPATATDVLRNLFSGKSFGEFIQNLKKTFEPKQGVVIPETILWNGVLDSGEIAPDGTYYYYLSAKDDNGNEAKTNSFSVVIDNTAPYIELSQPPEAAKIFGAANKSTLPIVQTGSPEDLWTSHISDMQGNKVRTFTWKNASPESVKWDGKDDSGVPAPDGVYSYKITSVDRAGNVSETAQITNIIYDAVPRSVNLMVKGSPFSPNDDGVKDVLTLEPLIPNAQGLVSWTMDIASSGMLVRTFTDTKVPDNFDFDGKNSSGTVLPDGDYQVQFKAVFNNGQEAQISRNFAVDNTPPRSSVRSETPIFSPDGDGNLDAAVISISTSKERQWIGEILDEKGSIVRTIQFADLPPSMFEWNGLTDTGTLAADGFFSFKVGTTDAAGNTGFAQTNPFELNTGTTEVILTVKDTAFSPNGDGVKDSLVLTPVIKTKSGIGEYTLEIINNEGLTVKTYADKRSLPASFSWNGLSDEGERCTDGSYTAKLATVSKNGSEALTVTQPFILDTVYPSLSLESPYTIFSPNGDTRKDAVPFEITTSEEKQWIGEILDSSQKVVSDFIWQGYAQPFEWNGTDETGNILSDGIYSFVLSSTDDAGNKTTGTIKQITIDTRSVKTYLTAELDAFSPNGDSFKDIQSFTIIPSLTDGIDSWAFEIIRNDAVTVRRWTNADSADLPSLINWDGKNSSGTIAEGNFIAKLEITYTKGDLVSLTTPSFMCSITPPKLTVRTAPEYFSPDNDGQDDDLFISLAGTSAVPFTRWSFEINDPQNGTNFWKTSGRSSITERIIWDGRSNSGELVQSATDYPYVFTVTDDLGMTSIVKGFISIDVLVIRIGDVLKIQVPSIIFRSDNADFKSKSEVSNGLEQSVIDNNIRVLKRIAEILNKFRDYTVRVEGHANNLTGTEKEELEELIPLSEARAAAVREMLIRYGVAGTRLTTVGVGGRQPVVSRDDRDNWWKNRRVEFILNK
ncbi:MAG: OmpA family protein [Spirochaetaceae bacterium]|nr:OmpA family protein [Spirochaetaceae bacterium]